MLIRCFTCLLFSGALFAQQTALGLLGGRGRQSGPPPAMDCAASGTVINALTGAPIPRAMIQGNPGGTATNAQGEWSITGQRCGRWNPRASHPGFLNGSYGAGPQGVARQALDLVSGTPATGIKISMMPESSVSGTVINTDGDPIEGAQIMVMRARTVNGYRVLTGGQGGRTDLRGNFNIDRIPPGRIIVCAISSEQTFPLGGGAPLVYPQECYPGPPSQGPSIAMPVEAGRDTHVSLTLHSTPGVHVRGVLPGVPRGRGAVVRLIPAPDAPRGKNTPFAGSRGMTSARPGQIAPDGKFDIENVTPGSYIAMARLGGGRGATAMTASARINVGAADVDGVQLAFESPVAVTGTVRYELAGGIPAPGAQPDGGAGPQPRNSAQNQTVRVNLNPAEPGTGGTGPAKWDDSRLNFSWAAVTPGYYNLNASVRGVQGAYIKSATIGGQDVLNQPLSIEGPTGPIEIVVSDDSGTFQGTVTDAAGNPAPGFVLLKSISRAGTTISFAAGDDGKATRANVPSGDYSAWAFDDISQIAWNEEDWMKQHAGAPVQVTISKSGAAPVTLKRIAAPAE
jgi:hypothetical protein